MSDDPFFTQHALTALETIARELTAIREGQTATNEWLDSINANLTAMVEWVETPDPEPAPKTIYTDTELPEEAGDAVPQNADGKPHMAYFDKATQTSFIWDGHQPKIEVSMGGYGEPVVDVFTPFDINVAQGATGRSILEWFEAQCLAYLILQRAENIANGEMT